MKVELNIKVEANQLIVFITDDKWELKIYNSIILIRDSDNDEPKILAVGNSEEELKRDYGNHWEKEKSKITIFKVFDDNNFNIDHAIESIRYFKARYLFEYRKRSFIKYLINMFSAVKTCLRLEYDYYENLPIEIRKGFEKKIRLSLNVNSFYVNGKKIEIKFRLLNFLG